MASPHSRGMDSSIETADAYCVKAALCAAFLNSCRLHCKFVQCHVHWQAADCTVVRSRTVQLPAAMFLHLQLGDDASTHLLTSILYAVIILQYASKCHQWQKCHRRMSKPACSAPANPATQRFHLVRFTLRIARLNKECGKERTLEYSSSCCGRASQPYH